MVFSLGLCPDWQDWDPNQGKRNATEAMDLAEKWLGVPQVIHTVYGSVRQMVSQARVYTEVILYLKLIIGLFQPIEMCVLLVVDKTRRDGKP